jgi:branched-chain amino acid transport system permease protein
MSGGVALQALVSGVSIGVIYGLVGLGFTVVHRLTRVYAFAHGDLVVGAVFVSVLVVVGSTPVSRAPSVGASIALAVLIPLAGAVLSALTYVLAVRPYLGGLAISNWLGCRWHRGRVGDPGRARPRLHAAGLRDP